MNEQQFLLTTATRFVDHAGGSPRQLHMACWLARQALEDMLDELVTVTARALDPGVHLDLRGMSARTKLATITVLLESTPVPRHALTAWDNLSQACHLPAYELSPTPAEVRLWLADVGELAVMHARLTGA